MSLKQVICTLVRSMHMGISLGVLLSALLVQVGAQTIGTGNIQGVVTDNTGAVLPRAVVVTTNTATQVKRTVSTDQNGFYSFPNLAIGTYSVDVTESGFGHHRQSNVILDVGSSIAVNVTLQVGGTEQEVEVQATGLALQTEDSSLKQTVDQKTLTELPLNGRQMTDLVLLMGGAVMRTRTMTSREVRRSIALR